MLRRLLDALALLAFPVSLYVAGCWLPRADPLQRGADAPVALMVATVAFGAVISITLAIARRRMRIARPSHEAPETVRWLIMGWPLPMPKWRTRTAPAASPPVSPTTSS